LPTPVLQNDHVNVGVGDFDRRHQIRIVVEQMQQCVHATCGGAPDFSCVAVGRLAQHRLANGERTHEEFGLRAVADAASLIEVRLRIAVRESGSPLAPCCNQVS
jgi:hypothetical protein